MQRPNRCSIVDTQPRIKYIDTVQYNTRIFQAVIRIKLYQTIKKCTFFLYSSFKSFIYISYFFNFSHISSLKYILIEKNE